MRDTVKIAARVKEITGAERTQAVEFDYDQSVSVMAYWPDIDRTKAFRVKADTDEQIVVETAAALAEWHARMLANG